MTSTEPQHQRETPARPWLTAAIGAALVASFALEVLAGANATAPTTDQLLDAGAVFGPRLVEGQWWRLLAGGLLHAGWPHLAASLLALWSAGRRIERRHGHGGLAALGSLAGGSDERLRAAAEACDRALQQVPGELEAHATRSRLRLALGDLAGTRADAEALLLRAEGQEAGRKLLDSIRAAGPSDR